MTNVTEEVYKFYQRADAGCFSPSQVYKILVKAKKIKFQTPFTSVRRAITTLTDKNRLIKTKHKLPGPYGRPEFLWRVNTENKQ